ncbi:hypothetical protein F503_05900 [Ophiostoma piceae UAMH 11346]|uniref:Myb-like domain-containing protein n=1 Tax=Ophiostoma piceae (strain UAMH 11346) TaxID=1262450 RepID=S3DB85_OPHP1|nr:hypothetical protein F503_05900 [Ophiostoma piceae UAMH 11346]
MDEPLPPTPTTPKSMALSSAQSSNGPVSGSYYNHKDGEQTPQSAKVKRDVDHSGTALWGLVPFNAQEQAQSLGQTQPSYLQQTGTGQHMCSYSNSILQPVSASHMASMPAIQEGQPLHFDPLQSGYHHQNMQLVGDALFQEQQQTATTLPGFHMTDIQHSTPMSASLSLSPASPGSGERQNAPAPSACTAHGRNGGAMARSRSNIEATANTNGTTASNEAAYHAAAYTMSRATSERTRTASDNRIQGQPLLDGSADSSIGTFSGEAMPQTAPMQHSLSSQSNSSGSSFISQSALHPLFAPSVIPTAFYGTSRPTSGTVYPFLGQMQPQHPPRDDNRDHTDSQWAGVKRPASSLGHQMTPQTNAKRKMKAVQIKEEEVETPCINSDNHEILFDFDDFIDMAHAHRTTVASTSGSVAAPLGVHCDGLVDQTISSELMHSIEILSSEAAHNTTLVTAAAPYVPNIRHDGTVSPEDLCIRPFSDTQPPVKQESNDGPSSCTALVSTEQTNFFPVFDPIFIGSCRGRSSADNSHTTEVDLGARGMDEVYPFGSSIGSPTMPHTSPISNLNTDTCHNRNCDCNHHSHNHGTMVHQPGVGHETHIHGNQSSYPPPDLHAPHGHPSPYHSHDPRGPLDPHDPLDPRDPRDSYHIPDVSSVPRSARGPTGAESETELIRMRAAEEQRRADLERRRKDRVLLQLKREGYTYREIREKGNFTEAESTLRGRYRTLTKTKQERVRKPTWTEKDDRLLVEAVNFMGRGRPMGQFKVAWKAVSERIRDEEDMRKA